MADAALDDRLATTPLHALHRARGAKMAPFAGYDMPIQYTGGEPAGVMGEHRWTRERAGLFDVSHMGQASLIAPDDDAAAKAIEAVTPMDASALQPGETRYTLLLNDEGGIVDDLLVTRAKETGVLRMVVNAARKAVDYPFIEERLPAGVRLERHDDRALLALQGPAARGVIAAYAKEAADLTFMTAGRATLLGEPIGVSCSGYTGEDGFELSIPAERAVEAAQALLDHPDVGLIGLGARDSLRLEAGLCLYGHDMDETTTPVEASLTWAVAKSRRERADFPGAARILAHIADKPARKRVGLVMTDRAPAREGAVIVHNEIEVGVVTSGGFGPSVEKAVAMGYVPPALAKPGTQLSVVVRDKPRSALAAPLPFQPHRYVRA